MVVNSVDQVLDSLRDTPLLRTDQLEELENTIAPAFPDAVEILKHLVKLGWLTLYQAKKILNGRASELCLGPYIILEKIGEGGMGKVFRAWQTRLSRVVALKVIRQSLLCKETALKRFQREAKAAAQLTHNNIVRLFDADHIGDRHYLAMEYVEGIDLSDLIKENGPLPVPTACSFIRQAALGLQHAHEMGVVHRDIKPSNLLVSTGGRTEAGTTGVGATVKILDMGLARVIEPDGQTEETALTQTGTVVGTPDYMSPEQGKNSSAVDPRSDLYSLGCTFYFLLAGHPPFPKGPTLEKLLLHQMEVPRSIHEVRKPELGRVPPAVEQILMKLLAKRPEDRFQSGQELAKALETCSASDSSLYSSLPTNHHAPSAADDTPSPFNFDDEDDPAQVAVVVRVAGAGRSEKRPTAEADTEEMAPPERHRRVWLFAGIGWLAVLILVAGMIIWLGRKPKSAKIVPAEPDLIAKTETNPVKKEIDSLESVLNYLPEDTQGVAILNVNQVHQSLLLRDEILPQLDPDHLLDQIRLLIKFDPLVAVERLIVALPKSTDKSSWLLIAQGDGFLTPELIEMSKYREKSEVVAGKTVRYYESSPKPDEPVLYAIKLSASATMIAVSASKQLAINTYLRKDDAGLLLKKEHLDPELHLMVQKHYSSAQSLFLAFSHVQAIPNKEVAKIMKGVEGGSFGLKIGTEMDCELQMTGSSQPEIVVCKNSITTLIGLLGGLKKENRSLVQTANMLTSMNEPIRIADSKKSVVVQWRHHFGEKESRKWLRGFFNK